MTLADINTVSNEGVIARDLIYKNETCAFWNLGTMRNLQFRIYLDNDTQPTALPLSNPLNVTFKIIHMSM